jgi:archaellum biogenesis ATPase FlaH
MSEQKIVAAAIQSRQAFDELLDVEIDKDLSDKAAIIWKEVKEYYAHDPEAEKIDTEVLSNRIYRLHEKHKEILKPFFDNVHDVSVPNLMKEVLEQKLDVLAHKMSGALAGQKYDEYEKYVDQFAKLRLGELEVEGKKAEVAIGKSVQEVIKTNSSENRIKIYPKALNDKLDGGALRQNHIVVFAPTDMGKSLFVINMACGFLVQGLKPLYVCNEDPTDAMLMRFMNRLTSMTKPEIEANPDEADRRLAKRNYHNLVFAEASPGTEKEIEELIEEHQPDVLIVDQIRNLNMKESSRVLQLERAAMMMRRFAKQYNMVSVSITQAADSATGKLLLDRGDIDSSNVGIPGTADLMIGIGADADMEVRGDRMLSLVKNKIGRGQKEPVRVMFDNQLSKVT